MNYAQFTPALTSLLGVSAQILDQREANRKVLQAMENEVEAYKYNVNITSQQIQDLDRAVGDKLTERGMEAIKTEARLRAGAAETGTSGGTTTMAIQDAYMQEHLDQDVIMRQGDASKTEVFRNMSAEKFGFTQRLTSIADSMMSPEKAGLSMLSTFTSSAVSGISMLGQEGKEDFFNLSGEG